MMRSLYSGVSGLTNHQVMLDVIGNNVANVNTYGFKAGRVTFRELFVQTIYPGSAPSDTAGGINPQQVGLGMDVASIDNLFTQGSMESTGRIEDLAMEGEGFFILQSQSGYSYTRAGNFQIDASGNYVSSTGGMNVMGWTDRGVDADGNPIIDTSGAMEGVSINYGEKIEANATSRVDLRSNLNANEVTAIGNILESQRIFVHPSSGDNLVDQLDFTGTELDLDDGEFLRYTANGSSETLLTEYSNTANSSLGLVAGVDTIDFTIDDGILAPTVISVPVLAATDTEALRLALTSDPRVTADFNSANGRFTLTNDSAIDLTLTVEVQGGGNLTFDNTFFGTSGIMISSGGTSSSSAIEVMREWEIGTDITTVGTLGSRIQAAMQLTSAGATVDYINTNPDDADSGCFNYAAVGSDLYGVTLEMANTTDAAPNFLSNMQLNSETITVADPTRSTNFFSYAEADDLLGSLMDTQGNALVYTAIGDPTTFSGDPLGSGQDIIIDGAIGGVDLLNPGYLAINGTTTLDELLTAIDSAFGIANTTGVVVTADGRLQINADPGQNDEINLEDISISTYDNSSVFAGTASNFNETQVADGGHQTSIMVYDSQGAAHNLNVYFEKVGTNQWTWQATLPEEPGAVLTSNNGTIDFSEGLVVSTNPAPISITVDGAPQFSVSLNINGTEGGSINTLAGVTQFADGTNDHTTRAIYQNGYAMGVLRDIEIALDGTLSGVYTNDKRIPIAVLAIASFQNNEGLLKSGSTMFQESANSGIAMVGQAGAEGRGGVSSGRLEMSNVNLATEFTKMVIAQRGFQANAKTITTADTILGELLQLKR